MDTQPFRHYITTRFNTGIYEPKSRLHIPPEEWMQHRMRLFTTFTLPSILNQSCQNFTWLILMDPQTPEAYIQEFENLRYPNLKLTYLEEGRWPWLQGVAPGDYDLITTRLDNDDALGADAVEALQQTYLAQRGSRAMPWVMVFPFGLILDLAGREMWVMEYWFNNCPTLVEPSREARTVWQWDHSNIPAHVEKHYIKDKPYWLQVVHTQNVLNTIPEAHHAKIVHKDLAAPLSHLRHFGVTPERLPTP